MTNRHSATFDAAPTLDEDRDPGWIFVTPEAYADPVAWHRSAAWLRRESPVHRVEAPGYEPFYAVTRHADIKAIERASDVFHNTLESVLQTQEVNDAQAQIGPVMRNLTQMDGVEHRTHRDATVSWFRPTEVRRLTDRIAELAVEAVDVLEDRGGECDLVRDVALRYPLHVIMEILGVPREDEPRMLQLTQELFGSNDPEFSRGMKIEDMVSVIRDFARYFNAIARSRREQPNDDLASAVANATIDGEPMGKLETTSYFILIATAGHDTTSSSIAGGLDVLLDHPDQLDRLRESPELIPNAVDEIIRWATPVKHFMRRCQAETEINGHIFHPGDWLLLSYASANRDEAVFEEPDRFDITRSNARENLSFGFGAHFCLGAHLARLEIAKFLEEFLSRVEHIERTGPAEYTATTFVGGPKRLPVRYRLRTS